MADETTQQQWPEGHEPPTQEQLDERQQRTIRDAQANEPVNEGEHQPSPGEGAPQQSGSDAGGISQPAPGGESQQVTAGGQPHEVSAPTAPLDSGSAPLDALASSPQPPQATGGVPATVEGDGPIGPEDALDPGAENRGDYHGQAGRVDDAAHFTHRPIPDEELTPDGPRSAPVPQNRLAEQNLGSIEETAAPIDPAQDAQARVAAEQEQLAREQGSGETAGEQGSGETAGE